MIVCYDFFNLSLLKMPIFVASSLMSYWIFLSTLQRFTFLKPRKVSFTVVLKAVRWVESINRKVSFGFMWLRINSNNVDNVKNGCRHAFPFFHFVTNCSRSPVFTGSSASVLLALGPVHWLQSKCSDGASHFLPFLSCFYLFIIIYFSMIKCNENAHMVNSVLK